MVGLVYLSAGWSFDRSFVRIIIIRCAEYPVSSSSLDRCIRMRRHLTRHSPAACTSYHQFVGLHAGMWMEFQIFHRFTEKRRSIYTNNNNMFLYVQTHTHAVPPANTWGSPHTNIHPYIQWTSMHKCILHLHLYRCWYSSLCHGFSAECNTFPHTFLLIRTMWCVILHKLYHIQWLTILSAKFVSFVFHLGGISCCLPSLSFANYSEIFIVLSWFLHVHHLASVLTQRGEP